MPHRTFGLAAALLLALSASPAYPRRTPFDPLMHGALVYHGNYCGPGNKGNHPAPVDALDEACMRHDACVKDLQLPACGCNVRLEREAASVAQDPREPRETRAAAEFTARGAEILPCQP